MIKRLRRHHGFMWSYSKAMLDSFRRPAFVFVLVISVTAMTAGATAFFFAERAANAALSTWFDALYFTVTTMTGVGFGDIVPQTIAGRALAIGMMLLGTAIFVTFTAVLATSLIEIELRFRKYTDQTRD